MEHLTLPQRVVRHQKRSRVQSLEAQLQHATRDLLGPEGVEQVDEAGVEASIQLLQPVLGVLFEDQGLVAEPRG